MHLIHRLISLYAESMSNTELCYEAVTRRTRCCCSQEGFNLVHERLCNGYRWNYDFMIGWGEYSEGRSRLLRGQKTRLSLSLKVGSGL